MNISYFYFDNFNKLLTTNINMPIAVNCIGLQIFYLKILKNTMVETKQTQSVQLNKEQFKHYLKLVQLTLGKWIIYFSE